MPGRFGFRLVEPSLVIDPGSWNPSFAQRQHPTEDPALRVSKIRSVMSICKMKISLVPWLPS